MPLLGALYMPLLGALYTFDELWNERFAFDLLKHRMGEQDKRHVLL